jgi:hypothetical protein
MKTRCFNSALCLGLMSGAALVLSVCYAFSDTPDLSTSTTGSTTVANLIRAAMEKEVNSQNPEREALLQQAVSQDPNDPAAHWQLGQVRVGNAWLTPAEAEQSAQQDRRLTEYRRLRDAAGSTARDQIALARWCHNNKYYEEERLHLLLAYQLQPGQPEAVQGLSNLGLHMHDGKLMTDAQIARADNQAQKIVKAMEEWGPFVAKWQRANQRHETSPPAEVRARIAEISTPAEMRGLEWAILRHADANKEQRHRIVLELVRTLAENPNPVAANSLARQGVFSEYDDVRSAAAEGLRNRHLDQYVPLLLSGLQTPIEADIKCMLSASGHLVTQYSYYREGALEDFSSTVTSGPVELAPNLPADGQPSQSAYGMAKNQRRNAARSMVQANQETAALHDRVDAMNDQIHERNVRILAVLTQTTGKDLGDDPVKWWDWWLQEYNGMYGGEKDSTTGSTADKSAHQGTPLPGAESKSGKPVVSRSAFRGYQVQDAPQPYTGAPAPGYQSPGTSISISPSPTGTGAPVFLTQNGQQIFPHSCFAPGTKVWTQTGRIPIGQVKIGDRVLAQNVESGELAYRPVVAVTTRGPGTRLKMGLGPDSIMSTPTHPFWVLGEGWQMSKQLDAGKTLHALSGGVKVESIEEQSEADQLPAEFAYNLIVDDFHTFFVGDQGLLVHDNTPREPTAALVPGVLPQATDTSNK